MGAGINDFYIDREGKNRMKKRILSTLLASTIILGAVPLQAAAASTDDVARLITLAPVTYYSGKTATIQKDLNPGAVIPVTATDSLDTLYGWYADPSSHLVQSGPLKDGMSMWYAEPEKQTLAFTEESPMWLQITKAREDALIFTDKFIVKRDTRIGNYFWEGVTTLNFNGEIKIENGTLMFRNQSPSVEMGYTDTQAIEIHLSEPIVVSEVGTLILENRYGTPKEINAVPDVLIAPEGQPAIIVEDGTVHSGCFQIERSEDDTSSEPLVEVQSGEFIFEAGPSSAGNTETGMPTYQRVNSSELATVLKHSSSEAPAVRVKDGASVAIKGGEFESSGTSPVFEVESGATLTLPGGTVGVMSGKEGENTITAVGEPAISVENGGKLIFAEGAESQVSSTENND